jgi:hypothetical protein
MQTPNLKRCQNGLGCCQVMPLESLGSETAVALQATEVLESPNRGISHQFPDYR